MHSCQRKCICGSLNACSDQVFATLSMLYLPIADCRLPVALCSAHCTNHCTVCTVQIADCRACLEYCICRLHLRLLVGCYALAISVQCSLLLTAHCVVCTNHTALQFHVHVQNYFLLRRSQLLSAQCHIERTRNVF